MAPSFPGAPVAGAMFLSYVRAGRFDWTTRPTISPQRRAIDSSPLDRSPHRRPSARERVTLMRIHELRSIVQALDREMARLHALGVSPGACSVELLGSWAKLVEQLELRLPPELRACPLCGVVGSLAATRCRSCWALIDPWPPASA